MGRTLKRHDKGDDVRQLQIDLLRMLPGVHFTPTGNFEQRTEEAVRMLQHKLNLHKDPPGVAGPEVQRALSYSVIVISGAIERHVRLLDGKLELSPDLRKLSPDLGRAPYKPAPLKQYTGGWLAQLQPTVFPGMITPPPFYFRDPQHGPSPGTVISGGFSLGLVYRTAKDGRHWEFPASLGFFQNSQNTSSDPRYTLQISPPGAGVNLADPFASGPVHSALFSQITALINLAPNTIAIQPAVGAQVSYDIIEDKLNISLQGNCGPQWNLTNGQFQFGCAGVLAATLQWELHPKHHH